MSSHSSELTPKKCKVSLNKAAECQQAIIERYVADSEEERIQKIASMLREDRSLIVSVEAFLAS
eukprot:2991323-Alexandrium_andersonii.AAC.1